MLGTPHQLTGALARSRVAPKSAGPFLCQVRWLCGAAARWHRQQQSVQRGCHHRFRRACALRHPRSSCCRTAYTTRPIGPCSPLDLTVRADHVGDTLPAEQPRAPIHMYVVVNSRRPVNNPVLATQGSGVRVRVASPGVCQSGASRRADVRQSYGVAIQRSA